MSWIFASQHDWQFENRRTDLLFGIILLLRSVLEMVVEQITVDLDAVVGSLFRELFPREHEVARWIGLESTNKRIAREIGATN